DDAVLRARPDGDAAETGIVDPSVDFAACEDWHFLIFDETDATAEIWNDVLAEAKTERKNVVALEEERALFGKEQRKACQIRAPRVHFRFREVGVHRS